MTLCVYLCTDHREICGQLENCTLTFVCPFIKARGDEVVSGDSDYVHDDTFSEMEEEGMEEIPQEILNAIDSFNVESDEEFLGFE